MILAVILGSITFSTTFFLLPGKDYTIIRIVDKVSSGATMETYAHRIADSIEEVFDLQDYWNIKIEVDVLEPNLFEQVVFDKKNYDIAIVELNYTSMDPDISFMFSENGAVNIFGTSPDLPYGNETEILLGDALESTNTSEYREIGITYRQLMYEWIQQLIMDKVVTFLPLFIPRIYEATWSNLDGYDGIWGVADSLPYMSFDGLHTGQTSINDLRLFETAMNDFNPLNQGVNSNDLITNLIDETLIEISPEGEPLSRLLLVRFLSPRRFSYVQAVSSPELDDLRSYSRSDLPPTRPWSAGAFFPPCSIRVLIVTPKPCVDELS